jgi:succinyl-diaminopimelate desuccinylase
MKTEALFEKLLRFKSITPYDDGAFEFIKNYLSEFEAIEQEIQGVKNLFLMKRFGEGIHLCFAGHIDVVPPGEGWSSEPFEPKYEDGKVFARGTQDMKSGVCAFLQACREAKEFQGTLSVLLTSDEEGDAKYGTVEMLKYLKDNDLLPDCAIVAEPTSEVVFGDAIKIGRRGSINGVIEIFGKQGHAAYPNKAINPVHQLAPLLSFLAGKHLDEGDASFEPSMMVITDIRGGMEVSNVTPGKVKVMFNVRNSTKTTREDICAYVDEVLKGLDYTLTLSQSAKPFVTNSSAPIVRAVQKALLHVKKIDPKLSTAGGTSDARFFGEFGVETIECGVPNDTIHAPNECCALADVEALVEVFSHVITHLKEI